MSLSDIEIARQATMQPIGAIAEKLDIPDESILPYGRTKAKIDLKYIDSLKDRPDGKLILVTAITPTQTLIGSIRTAQAPCRETVMADIQSAAEHPFVGIRRKEIDYGED